ncbi:hypothetical protein [Leifsonia sp. Le1]|uniref:hypothetical protein n=1 Tax=Leifsonia sp. Le1 TaxID=3404918 RepID=UPI003EBC3202
MNIRKPALIGGVIATVLLVGMQALPALAVSPATPSASAAPPVSASAQAVHEAAVARFLATNPKPATLTAPASPAVLAQNRTAWLSYLEAAPWTDIFGQWGCTVSDLSVVMSTADDGTSYPTVRDVADCGGVEALTGIVGTIDTTSSVLAQPANAHLRAQLSRTAPSNATR